MNELNPAVRKIFTLSYLSWIDRRGIPVKAQEPKTVIPANANAGIQEKNKPFLDILQIRLDARLRGHDESRHRLQNMRGTL